MESEDLVPTEPRWPAMLTLLFVFALTKLLPGRYQLLPGWLPWTAFILTEASMLAVTLAPASRFWHRVERYVVLALVATLCSVTILIIERLIVDMLALKRLGGLELLESATMVWTMNVALFALLYWQTDRGLRELRPASDLGRDFAFAEKEEPEAAVDWEPTFVDYLFLAFLASTSFAPPDYSRPRSHRAKLALMLQASISLTTLFVIASRAIASLS